MSATRAPAPSAMYDAYRRCCAEQAALPPEQWTFKADPRYTAILEHVTPAQATGYLHALWDDTPAQDWPMLREVLRETAPLNDRLGFPVSPGGRAPSNLRYLHHAVLVCQHAARCGLCRLHVVELGGGYGGLALYLHRVADGYGLLVERHTSIDLPEACALQAAYAKAIGLPLRTANGLDPAALDAVWSPHDGAARCFVSAYAFSEFSQALRDYYVAAVLRHCAHGWLVWNGEAHPAFAGPVYPFLDTPLTVTDERPLTGHHNKVVTW